MKMSWPLTVTVRSCHARWHALLVTAVSLPKGEMLTFCFACSDCWTIIRHAIDPPSHSQAVLQAWRTRPIRIAKEGKCSRSLRRPLDVLTSRGRGALGSSTVMLCIALVHNRAYAGPTRSGRGGTRCVRL
ncbi:hypothetical protein LIA77_00390 [Sarocladium implicatum]|nr:hypothetical protein LIA77_00390 [Sarocladium implicatum]